MQLSPYSWEICLWGHSDAAIKTVVDAIAVCNMSDKIETLALKLPATSFLAQQPAG